MAARFIWIVDEGAVWVHIAEKGAAMRQAVCLALLLLPGLSQADEVFLRSGGRLTGEIVERREDFIVLDVGGGQVGFSLSAVERIEPGPSPLAQYAERVGRLADKDSEGWWSAGVWARDHDLPTQARQAFEHVLALDPDSALAHAALGHVRLDDRWVTEDESYEARGYVRFEGSWVTPQERRANLAERSAWAEEEQARKESDARIREAEARARTAEAEAERAEAANQEARLSFMMPYGGVLVGGFGFGSSSLFGRGFHFGFPDRSRFGFPSSFQFDFPRLVQPGFPSDFPSDLHRDLGRRPAHRPGGGRSAGTAAPEKTVAPNRSAR